MGVEYNDLMPECAGKNFPDDQIASANLTKTNFIWWITGSRQKDGGYDFDTDVLIPAGSSPSGDLLDQPTWQTVNPLARIAPFRVLPVLLGFLRSIAILHAGIPQAVRDDPRYKLGYLVVTSYPGVDPTGTSDSLSGLQAAIDDGYANGLVTLFPTGTDQRTLSPSYRFSSYSLIDGVTNTTAERVKTATRRQTTSPGA